MGLFTTTPKKVATPVVTTKLHPEALPNLVGQYISALVHGADTRAIVASIKRANDFKHGKTLSSVRFQQFLIDYVSENAPIHKREHARIQIKQDFSLDSRVRHEAMQYDKDLYEVRNERDECRQQVLRLERKYRYEKERRRQAESQLQASGLESQEVIERLDEELQVAQRRISAVLIAVAQPPEGSAALRAPRSRTASQYGRPVSGSFQLPSPSPEPASAHSSSDSDTPTERELSVVATAL